MRKHLLRLIPLAAIGLAFGGCDASDGDNVLGVDATGTVYGWVFVDRNGDGSPTPGVDLMFTNTRVLLTRPGSSHVLAEGRTDQSGVVRLQNVPVGRYRLRVDAAALADSVRVSERADTATFTVAAVDSTLALLPLTFRPVTAGELRTLPVGRMVSLEGVALNSWAVFGDSTVHVADATGAVRVTRLPSTPVTPGDSVRVIGRVTLRDGQRVLAESSAFTIGRAIGGIDPRALSTAVAASASDGTLDAALARITGGAVLDTLTQSGNVRLTVDDGSGPVVVVLDGDARLVPNAPITPGAVLDVTGVLVPDGEGAPWTIKPRVNADLNVRFPTIPILQARAAAAGTRVIVTGIALHSWGNFADGTIRLADAGAAIRVLHPGTLGNIATGDSIRVLGTIQERDGQPAIGDATVTRITAGTARTPRDLSTAVAAQAQQGTLDANLARVQKTMVVFSQDLPNGDVRVTVNDGSGPLELLLTGNRRTIPHVRTPGAQVTVTGVLVPATEGPTRWQLMPRTPDDVTAEIPVVSIAEARGRDNGVAVAVEGIVLNGIGAFGDNSIHVADRTAAIRIPSASGFLAAGDSVRIVGTLNLVTQQPQITNASITVLGRASVPAPLEVLSGAAARADGGALDAQLVRVRNASIDSTWTAGGAFRMRVNNGDGPLEVEVRPTTGILTGNLTVGARFDLTGLLLWDGVEKWVLRPRSREDVTSAP